jgi:hypothetical protein
MRKWKIRIRGPLAADLPAVCAAVGRTLFARETRARAIALEKSWYFRGVLGLEGARPEEVRWLQHVIANLASDSNQNSSSILPAAHDRLVGASSRPASRLW